MNVIYSNKKKHFFMAKTSYLKAIHCTIIIEVLSKCLLVAILMVPLESLITHPEALLF